jgi:phage gpG-like protein
VAGETLLKEFSSITQFVEFLRTREAAVHSAQVEGMREAGHMLQHEAQHIIGEYQDAVGPFPKWEPLSDATLNGGVDKHGRWFPGKIDLGYAPPDNPLLRTGHMRGSIECSSTDHEVVLGTHDPVAADQEFGTHSIPPRPFIGPTMFRHVGEAVDIITHHVIAAMTGSPKPRTK